MPVAFDVSPILRTGAYRHMSPLDVAVWERYLTKFGTSYSGVTYDLALGGVALPEGLGSDNQRAGWNYSTALKIDAVLWEPIQAWIVEVKPWALPSAIGAVVTYTMLAQRERITELPLRPLIVCEGSQPDVEWVAEQLGITVAKV